MKPKYNSNVRDAVCANNVVCARLIKHSDWESVEVAAIPGDKALLWWKYTEYHLLYNNYCYDEDQLRRLMGPLYFHIDNERRKVVLHSQVIVAYQETCSKGYTKAYEFPDDETAEAFYNKLIEENRMIDTFPAGIEL